MAPLKGELSAQLTEGSGLANGQASPKANILFPPSAEAFLTKSRTPQTRLTPGQLPFQGSQELPNCFGGALWHITEATNPRILHSLTR